MSCRRPSSTPPKNPTDGADDKPKPQILTDDAAVLAAAADLIASGEVTGKALEVTLLHKPAGLKAKRLLLIGGGKAKAFSTSELRKIAGAAVRAVKAKDVKSFRTGCARYRQLQCRRRSKIHRRRRIRWRLRC